MHNNMLEPLEQTAAEYPERTAFFDDREHLTYAALVSEARHIGTAIANAAQPRTPVALLLDARSLRNIPAIYGALYAGCPYAPMDISMPPERLQLLLELLAPGAVLADERGMAALRSVNVGNAAVICYEEAARQQIDAEKLRRIRTGMHAEDPMSILYTSGSTGIPKGSVQTHRSYLHWTEATIRTYGFDGNVVFGNQSPFFYANAIIDIFPPVALGASVYLLPGGVLAFPRKMVECMNRNHVTELTMTPSSFIVLSNSGCLSGGCLPELRWGIMSGESMPWEPLAAWMQAAPNAFWWHFYGSTEMFSVAVGKVEKPAGAGERLPVGRPFPEVSLLFVDENGQPVPDGEPGEMLVSSPWVAAGYYRDPLRTEASWSMAPMDGKETRCYRSGDIGCLRKDGSLVVLGRRDSQIKHMGYRMELGEVEAALNTLEGWQEGCVLFDTESGKIWCFFTGGLTEKEIRRGLLNRLARYMLPDVYVVMETMPHTRSMKLDRAALRQIMQRKGK